MRRILTLTCLALLCSLQPAPAQTGQPVPEGTAARQLSREDVLSNLTTGDLKGGGSLATRRPTEGQDKAEAAAKKASREMEGYTSSHKLHKSGEKISLGGLDITKTTGPRPLEYNVTPAEVGYSRNRPGLR